MGAKQVKSSKVSADEHTPMIRPHSRIISLHMGKCMPDHNDGCTHFCMMDFANGDKGAKMLTALEISAYRLQLGLCGDFH